MPFEFNWGDNEELKFLNDISQINEALGGSLSNDEESDQDQDKEVGLNSKVHSCDDELCDTDCFEPSWENCLGYNKAYQEVLKDSLMKLKQMLEDNLEHQECLKAEIEWNTDEHYCDIQRGICEFLYPYFRDKSGRIPKYNKDVLEKQKTDEKHVLSLKPRPWTHCELKLLKKSCIEDSLIKSIKPFILRQEILINKCNSLPDGESKSKIKEQIDDLESKVDQAKLNPKLCIYDRQEELNWLKISAVDFDGCRSPEECELMWNNLLHPSINKNKWTLEEDGLLEEAINKGGLKNWDFIAEFMKTNRTPYQCFVRYRTTCKMNEAIRPWSKEEDSLLLECIDNLKVGSYIPWIQVQQFLEGRTRVQVYHRWKYSLNPSIKKGQFTSEEDVLILAGVELFEDDFCRISCLLPGRTSCQVSKRYRRLQTVIDKNFGAPWTRAEDLKLIEVVKNQSLDSWRTIAEKFPGRDGNTCRRRFLSICKNCSRNPFLLQSKTAPLGGLVYKKRNPGLPKFIGERVAEVVNAYKSKNFTQEYVLNQKINVKHQVMYSRMAAKLLGRINVQSKPSKVKRHPLDLHLENLFFACGPRQTGRPYSQTNDIAIESQVKAIEFICHGLKIQLVNMKDFDQRNHEFNEVDNYLFEIIKDKMVAQHEKKVLNVNPIQQSMANKLQSLLKLKPALSVSNNFQTRSKSVIPLKVIAFPPNVSTLIGFRALLIHRTICSNQAQKLLRSSLSHAKGSIEPTPSVPIIPPQKQLVIRSYTNNKRKEIHHNPPPVFDLSKLSVEEITLGSQSPSNGPKNKRKLAGDEENAKVGECHGQLTSINNDNTSPTRSKRIKIGKSSQTEITERKNDEDTRKDPGAVINQSTPPASDQINPGSYCNRISNQETSIDPLTYVHQKNPKTYGRNGHLTPTVEKSVSESSPVTPSLREEANHILGLPQTTAGITSRYKATNAISNSASKQVASDNGMPSGTVPSVSSMSGLSNGVLQVSGNENCRRHRLTDPSLFLDDEIIPPVFNKEAERTSDDKLLHRLYSIFYWPALMSTNHPKETVADFVNKSQILACSSDRGNAKLLTDALILAEDSDTSISTIDIPQTSSSSTVRKRKRSRRRKKIVKELPQISTQDKQRVTRKRIDYTQMVSEPRRSARPVKIKRFADEASPSTTTDIKGQQPTSKEKQKVSSESQDLSCSQENEKEVDSE